MSDNIIVSYPDYDLYRENIKKAQFYKASNKFLILGENFK
jgi:hypothetical protein